MTPIADMIEAMLAAGAPLSAILVAVRSFEMSSLSSTTVGRQRDDRNDARRERDREWHRNYRAKQRLEREAAKANDVATVAKMSSPVVDDKDDKRCESYLLTESVIEDRGSQEEGSTKVVVEGRNKVSRGTRLSRGSQISLDDLQFALDAGLTTERVAQVWAEFVDYWIGIPGQRGTKLDWAATWRNRVRRVLSPDRGRAAPAAHSPSFHEMAANLRACDENPKPQFKTAGNEFAGDDGAQLDFGRGLHVR